MDFRFQALRSNSQLLPQNLLLSFITTNPESGSMSSVTRAHWGMTICVTLSFAGKCHGTICEPWAVTTTNCWVRSV